MQQLVMNDILVMISNLKKNGMPENEILNIPIYIGDDDELNGIHTAWFIQTINENSQSDSEFIEVINENSNNVPFNSIAFLIS